jgi:hypothetical protein
MGHGHFLLRVRGTFTTIAPLANLKHGHAFEEKPFLEIIQRRISVIQFSPDADFMMLETEPLPPPEPEATHASPMASFNAAVSGSPPIPKLRTRSPGVQISFYRLSPDPHDGTRIIPRVAGTAIARSPMILPANGTSFISALSQGPQTWAFDVTTYAGKVYELPLFDSTCHPVSAFVSKAEFIVFGCRGGSDPRRFAAFNLRGDEMWEKGFYETSLWPVFSFATSAGRFAMGRLIIDSTLLGAHDISTSQIRQQTIDVYQTANGNQLLHLDCSPVEPASQNFAISPDGMTLALRNNGAIAFYDMPPLTEKEQAAVKLAQSSAPEEIDAPVRINQGHTASSSEAAAPPPESAPQLPTIQAAQAPPTQPTPAQETATSPSAEPASSQSPSSQPTSEAGDPPAEQHRKPPTLYNAPGDPPPSERTSSQPQ